MSRAMANDHPPSATRQWADDPAPCVSTKPGPSNDCEQPSPHDQESSSALLAAMTQTMLGRRWYTGMDDASTRRFVEELLVAADASEALDRAEQRARAEAAKHREQE